MLQVSFRKRDTHSMALLQKMNYKDKASYRSSPPCNTWLYLCDKWVMSHISTSHGTHINESCHCKTSKSHVTHMRESCHIYEWVMSLIMSHVSNKWGAQHTAMTCHAYVNTSRHMCEWNMLLTLQYTATHCYNTLQQTATHCNTLQHSATHCSTLLNTATHCNTLREWGILLTLRHTTTHCCNAL